MSKQFTWKYIFRKRIKFFVLIGMILSFVFMFYQLFYYKQLNTTDNLHTSHSLPATALIRGIHIKQSSFYVPNEFDQFTCINSQEKIDFSQVNDDYCDCLDGSDEPGTNACSNGIFYCLFHDKTSAISKSKSSIPSTMVNDGICDCCDGSDEWNAAPLTFRLNDVLQKKIGHYQTPCRYVCPKNYNK